MTEFRPNARITGGTPSGLPDYRPINKLPRHEIAEIMRKARPRPRLYQLYVDWTGRGTVAVGPKCELGLVEVLRSTVLANIASGKELTWSNPSVLPVDALIGSP